MNKIINVRRIKHHQSLLGPLVGQYSRDGVVFQIYRAKRLHSPDWFSEEVRQLVRRARESYLRYGPVPRDDAYDAKSAIYITCASYTREYEGVSYPVQEWLSMRFVPTDGTPSYTEDLELCLCDGTVLVDWLLKSRSRKIRDIAKHNVAISRICSIPPKIVSYAVDTGHNSISLSHKLSFAGTSFALMNRQFLHDCAAEREAYRYITGIFRDEFINGALVARTGENKTVPSFTSACELLGLDDPSRIVLNRSLSSLYVYDFPAYFFKVDQLYALMTRLLQQGDITTATLMHFLQAPGDDGREWTGTLEAFKKILPRLGRLLTVRGPLYDSRLTGEELRDMINKNVDDGPILRIMNIDTWKKSIEEYLKLQKVR